MLSSLELIQPQQFVKLDFKAWMLLPYIVVGKINFLLRGFNGTLKGNLRRMEFLSEITDWVLEVR